jgi:hypothetical protein
MKSVVPRTNLSDSKQLKETLDSSISSLLEEKGYPISTTTNNFQLFIGVLACMDLLFLNSRFKV